MKVGISNDHGGLELKKLVVEHLKNKGYEVINYGTDSPESCDYPLAAEDLCQGFKRNEWDFGIAICTTGVGISIACNKHKGIRACCCSESVSAGLSREHNNANVICFGARVIGLNTAIDIVDTFLNTKFSNGERHLHRISLIKEIEDKQ